METKQLLAVLVAIVVIGGGVWYFSSKPALAPGAEEAAPLGDASKETGSEQTAGSGTLAQLMARSGSYRCTIQVKAADLNGSAESSGVVYVANNRLRGDFESKATGSNQTFGSHMISTDGYVYTWTDMSKQGFKMPVAQGSAGAQTQGSIDASAAVDYDCAPWAADSSRFDLPDLVTFMEMPAQ